MLGVTNQLLATLLDGVIRSKLKGLGVLVAVRNWKCVVETAYLIALHNSVGFLPWKAKRNITVKGVGAMVDLLGVGGNHWRSGGARSQAHDE